METRWRETAPEKFERFRRSGAVYCEKNQRVRTRWEIVKRRRRPRHYGTKGEGIALPVYANKAYVSLLFVSKRSLFFQEISSFTRRPAQRREEKRKNAYRSRIRDRRRGTKVSRRAWQNGQGQRRSMRADVYKSYVIMYKKFHRFLETGIENQPSRTRDEKIIAGTHFSPFTFFALSHFANSIRPFQFSYFSAQLSKNRARARDQIKLDIVQTLIPKRSNITNNNISESSTRLCVVANTKILFCCTIFFFLLFLLFYA